MGNDTSQYARLGYGLRSAAGARALNEDSAFIKEYTGRARQQRYLCMGAVADGMGGHQAGEVASSTAVQSLFEEFNAQKISYDRDPEMDTRQLLYQLFSLVNTTVYDIAKRDNKLKGMGTTLTAFLAEAGRAYVAHVGDSRAYLIRSGSISQMTEDHTLVQDMVRGKIITRKQAEARSDRNVITRAIGVDPTVEVDVISFPIHTGDILFLCSDGLYDVVGNHEILIALAKSDNLQAACQELVQHALDHGASDNVSAVAWAVPDLGEMQRQAAVARPDRTTTGTVVLPPERAYNKGMQRPLVVEKKADKWVLAAVFTVVIIAGFVLGWLIAGWVKGNGEEGSKQPDAESEMHGEGTGAKPDLVTSLREDTDILIMNAQGSQGQAAVAKQKLENLGYKMVRVGDAENTRETTIFFESLDNDKVNVLIDDLGMVPPTKKIDPELVRSWGVDIIVVLAAGWDRH